VVQCSNKVQCAGGSVDTCRASRARPIGDKKPDEEASYHPVIIAGVWA